MSYKDTVVQINKGQVMPTEAYKKLVDELKPNTVGFACAADGAILHQGDGVIMSPEEFDEFQAGFKEDTLFVSLSEYPNGFDPQDAQPYVLLSEEREITLEDDTTKMIDEPLLIVFIDGDYSNLKDPKSTRSDAFALIDKVIYPLMETFQEKNSKAGVAEFMNYLSTDSEVKREIEGAGVRGVVKFLGTTGEIITFSQNLIGGKFEWGEMSQSYGFGEKVYPEKVAKSGHKLRLFKTKAEAAAEEPKVTKVGATTILHKPAEVKKPDTAAPTSTTLVDMVLARPMVGKSKEERKAWYNKRNNKDLPHGWNSGNNGSGAPYIMVHKDNLGTNSELKNDQTAIAAAFQKNVTPKDVKSEQTLPVETSVKLPIVPETQLKAHKEIFEKSPEYIKATSGIKGIPTQADLEEDEKKYPSYFEKTGIHADHTLTWPDSMEMAYFKDYGHIALLRIKALKNMLAKMMNEHGSAHTTKEDETTKHVLAKEELAPPKKKLLRRA